MNKRRLVCLFAVLILIATVEVVLTARSTARRSDHSEGTIVAEAGPKEDVQENDTSIITPAPAEEENEGEENSAREEDDTDENVWRPDRDIIDTAFPTPSPPPESYGTAISQGGFSSYTGTGIELNVSWVAYDIGNDTAAVAVTGTVSSYSLQIAMMYNSVTVSFGGSSVACNSASISVFQDVYTVSPLFSVTLTVPLGTGGNMDVSWRYEGTYSGVELDTIAASGYVYTS